MRLINLQINDGFIQAQTSQGLQKIEDPFSKSKLLDYNRLANAGTYLPLFILQNDKFDNSKYRLIFLIKDNLEQAISWNLDNRFSYKSQERVNLNLISELFSFYKLKPETSWALKELENTEWFHFVKDIINTRFTAHRKLTFENFNFNGIFTEVGAVQGLWAGIRSAEKTWTITPLDLEHVINDLAINSEIAKNTLAIWRKISNAPPKLKEFMDTTIDSSDKIAVKGQRYFKMIHHTWLIGLLKELFFIFNHSHICFSPVSNQWILSKKSILVADREKSFRLCLYEEDSSQFIEIRDVGFLNCTNGFIFPLFSLPGIRTSNAATWFRNDTTDPILWKHAIPALINSIDDTSKEKYLIANNSTKINLGHFLWNDLSGIANFLKIIHANNFNADLLVATLAKKGNKFSPLSYAEICQDFLQFEKKTDQVSILEMPNTLQFETDHWAVCFKSLFIEKPIVDSYIRFFDEKLKKSPSLDIGMQFVHKWGGKRYIFFNVRTHNKALLNINDCISSLIDRIKENNLKDIVLLFEGDTSGSEILEGLVELCRANDISSEYFINITAYELFSLLRIANLVVAPIGSGLVIPTWILNRLCLVYADPGHLSQLMWWDIISGMTHNVYKFSADQIHPIDDSLYSSYTIQPSVFGKKIIQLMETQIASKLAESSAI